MLKVVTTNVPKNRKKPIEFPPKSVLVSHSGVIVICATEGQGLLFAGREGIPAVVRLRDLSDDYDEAEATLEITHAR